MITIGEINEEQANAIYDILVQECGAKETARLAFVINQTDHYVAKWKFDGNMGGEETFWHNHTEMYVTCSGENLTRERLTMIVTANNRLTSLAEGSLST